MKFLLAFAILTAIAVPAFAQEVAAPPPPANRDCNYVNAAYGPGATIGMGNRVMACAGDGTWYPTDATANCLFAGQPYSVGAKLDTKPELTCTAKGIWE